MARKMLLMVATVMALSVIALAAAKPNFSGTWNLDQGRSYGLPGNMNQILTITHKEDQIRVGNETNPAWQRARGERHLLPRRQGARVYTASTAEPDAA